MGGGWGRERRSVSSPPPKKPCDNLDSFFVIGRGGDDFYGTFDIATARSKIKKRRIFMARAPTQNNYRVWNVHMQSLPRSSKFAVQSSLIPGVGLGVIAIQDVPPGTLVSYYKGRVLQKENMYSRYQVLVCKGYIIDAEDEMDCIARYINHLPKGGRSNCRFVMRHETGGKKTVKVITTRTIRSGEEVYLNYGRKYWNSWNHRL